jgi:hypothetical protein
LEKVPTNKFVMGGLPTNKFVGWGGGWPPTDKSVGWQRITCGYAILWENNY